MNDETQVDIKMRMYEGGSNDGSEEFEGELQSVQSMRVSNEGISTFEEHKESALDTVVTND